MSRIEYKVVKVSTKDVFTRDVSPELESVLNAEGRDGWKLVNSIVPASFGGESERVVLVLMRERS